MNYDVAIIGGGPGGLACAKTCAGVGLKTIVLEKNTTIGKKVCAGGITWNGLIQRVPEQIAEKVFTEQHILTRYQKLKLTEKSPIIATVSRQALGQYMADKAIQAGAHVSLNSTVVKINKTSLLYKDTKANKVAEIHFRYLVGADGSSSLVRRHLKVPCEHRGVGLTCDVPKDSNRMEWHLNSKLFGNGYSWIFPHRKTCSIGAYCDPKILRPKALKSNFLLWGESLGLDLTKQRIYSGFINYDYRGHEFDNIFLVGDAAGLASGLTGEGIFPAIVSGEHVGQQIIDPNYKSPIFEKLLKNQALHSRFVTMSGKHSAISTLLSEFVCLMLRTKALGFKAIEMAR